MICKEGLTWENTEETGKEDSSSSAKVVIDWITEHGRDRSYDQGRSIC
jgi:hypothetical protein